MTRSQLFPSSGLLLQVRIDLTWVFQDERNGSVDLGQRPDGRKGFEDLFRRASIAKLLDHDVKADTRAGYVIGTVTYWLAGISVGSTLLFYLSN